MVNEDDDNLDPEDVRDSLKILDADLLHATDINKQEINLHVDQIALRDDSTPTNAPLGSDIPPDHILCTECENGRLVRVKRTLIDKAYLIKKKYKCTHCGALHYKRS